MPPLSRREGQQMVSSSTIALLLFLILPLLAQAIPLLGPRLSRQLSPPQQQQNAFQPPSSPNSFAGAVAGAPFSAQAFDPKLESARFEAPPPPPNSGLPQQQQQQPQFVANNGPLIRTPDGQFVLAPVNSLPHQHFGAASFQAGPVNGQPHLLPQQQFFFTPAAQQQQPFGGNNNLPPPPFIPPAPISLQQQSLAAASQPDGSPSSIQFTNSSNINNDTSSSSSSSSADAAHQSLPPPLFPSSFPTSTRPPPPVDKSVDLDGDGALSLNEVQYAAFVHHGLSSSVVENLFNEVDHNKDNFLSALEFNDIRPLVLSKAENAALRYLQNVDSDHNGLLSLPEAQAYILREYGISNRDVERIWRLVVPSSSDEMDAVLFSKLRRRVRGMSIRLARQIMKAADRGQDGHIDLREAQLIAFEQEGIGPAEVVEMLASVDDNSDGQLNAPEFADFERIVRAKAVETSKKALKVVDTDGSGSLTMDEAKKIAFDHYGFDEATLEPFFAQADENEDGQLDAVEFAGFRSVIRGRAVKIALGNLPEMDEDGDGVISEAEAEQRTRKDDDMSASETHGLFSIADQDRNGLLDKVELADFVRLVRLTSIKFVADHFRDYDSNRDKLVTLDELERLVRDRYKLDAGVTRRFFDKVDVDRSGDLNAGEIVDFRREIRRFAQDRAMQAELEEQNRREMAEIEQKMREEANQKELKTGLDPKGVRNEEGDSEKIVEDGNEGEDGNDGEDGSEEDEEKRRVAEEMEKKRNNKKRKNKKKIDKHEEEEGEEKGQQHGQAMPERSMNNDGGRSGTAMMLPTTSESTTTTVIRTMMTTTTVSSTATPTTETRMMMNEEQLNSGGQARTNETSLRNVKDNGQDGEEDEERAATKVLLINQETVNRMNNNENNNSSSIHGNSDGDKGKMPIKTEDNKNDNLSVQHRGENMIRENVLVQTTSNNNSPSMSHPVMTKKDGITIPPPVTESTIIEETGAMTTMKKMRKRRRKTTTAIPSTTTVAASESYEEDEAVGEVEKRKIK